MAPPSLASEPAALASGCPLPSMILVPFVGAVVDRARSRSSRARPRARSSRRSCSRRSPARWPSTCWPQFDSARRRLPVRRPTTTWISDLGISLAPRRRRHLAVPAWCSPGSCSRSPCSAPKPDHDEKAYYAWLLRARWPAASACSCSLDLVLFFVFFEIVLVPMYFLIGGWGHGNRIYAATKFFLYTMFGSAFMLVGIVALAVPAPAGRRRHRSPSTSSRSRQRPGHLGRAPAAGSSCRFAIAFAVKVPLFPLHTWLPDAHTEAPTAGSVILAGVMLKLGTYGFLRFGLYLFPEASQLGRPGAADARRHRHHLRRHRRHDAEGPQAARRLLVGRPPRLHRARHLRPHHAGHRGRRPADGQPRHLDRRAVPPGRLDLRAPPHPRDRRAVAACRRSAPIFAGVFTARHAVVDRPARPQRLRRRVPRPARRVHRRTAGGPSSPSPA